MDLKLFKAIGLREMENVSLMKRTDTKFVFPYNLFEDLIQSMELHYDILEINDHRIQKYKTNYFDNELFTFYSDHHNKKENRMKIRIREYVNSKICFLEVKRKVKGHTIKSRILINNLTKDINLINKQLMELGIKNIGLKYTLTNTFDRITFVNKNKTERLTIDTHVKFELEERKFQLSNIAIAELKQSRIDRSSFFFKLMKMNNIRPFGISKYCTGLLNLEKNENIKYNRFKQKSIYLDKLNNKA